MLSQTVKFVTRGPERGKGKRKPKAADNRAGFKKKYKEI